MVPDIVAAALHRLTDEVIGLRAELSRTREEILPRLAVLEADTKAKGAKGERRWQTRLAVVLAVLALLGNFVQPFLGG